MRGWNRRKNKRYRWAVYWRSRGHVKKRLVETCVGVVDVFTVAAEGFRSGWYPMTQPITGESLGRYLAMRQGASLTVTCAGRAVFLTLVSIRQHFGGACWYVLCPRCGRRVRKLYLPRPGDGLACRTCHDLAYRTQQQHKCGLLPVGVFLSSTAPTLPACLLAQRAVYEKINRAMRQAGCEPVEIPEHLRG